MTSRQLGIAQIVVSGLCFGLLGFLGKLIYRNGLTPGELLSLRFLAGAGFLGLFIAATQIKLFRLKSKEFAACFALGVFGYAVFSTCFFTALGGLSSSLTVLLLYTYPAVVTVGAWIIFGEKIPRERFLSLPLVLIGLFFLIGADFHVEKASALIFGIGASIFYSLYILASSRWLKNTNPLASTFYVQLSAGVVLALFHLRDTHRIAEIVGTSWHYILLMGLVCSAMAMGFFLAGLAKLKNWEVSVLSTTEPITAILIAIVFLGERLNALQAIGAGCVFAALIFVSIPVKGQRQSV